MARQMIRITFLGFKRQSIGYESIVVAAGVDRWRCMSPRISFALQSTQLLTTIEIYPESIFLLILLKNITQLLLSYYHLHLILLLYGIGIWGLIYLHGQLPDFRMFVCVCVCLSLPCRAAEGKRIRRKCHRKHLRKPTRKSDEPRCVIRLRLGAQPQPGHGRLGRDAGGAGGGGVAGRPPRRPLPLAADTSAGGGHLRHCRNHRRDGDVAVA